MTQVQSLRPLGDADLAALRARFEPLLAQWALGWLTAQPQGLTLVPRTARAQAQALQSAEPGTVYGAGPAVLSVGSSGLLGWGRVCVLEGDKLLADTRFNDVLTTLGGNALGELVASLLELKEVPLTSTSAQALTQPDFDRDGVQFGFTVAGQALTLFVPRAAVARWLLPLRASAQRLPAVRLPARLGQAPVRMSVRSRPFDMQVTEFLQLAQGNVITLDQRLDGPFEVHVQDHPEIALKSYPGRCGQTLAMEVFEN